MEKTSTISVRVNPHVKKQAEEVLQQLGIPMGTAVDMFLRQVSMQGGLPFQPLLPAKAPSHLNADMMTSEQLRAALQEGLDDIEAGRVRNANEAFAAFRKARR